MRPLVPPDDANNGRPFARTDGPSDPCCGTSRCCHEQILPEFGQSAADPRVADPSARILFPDLAHPRRSPAGGPVERTFRTFWRLFQWNFVKAGDSERELAHLLENSVHPAVVLDPFPA